MLALRVAGMLLQAIAGSLSVRKSLSSKRRDDGAEEREDGEEEAEEGVEREAS